MTSGWSPYICMPDCSLALTCLTIVAPVKNSFSCTYLVGGAAFGPASCYNQQTSFMPPCRLLSQPMGPVCTVHATQMLMLSLLKHSWLHLGQVCRMDSTSWLHYTLCNHPMFQIIHLLVPTGYHVDLCCMRSYVWMAFAALLDLWSGTSQC